MIWYRLRVTLEMIKFEHSIFALPFALTGALLAFRQNGFATAGIWHQLLWIVVAMVAARSAAMAFNRVIDADAGHPRRTAIDRVHLVLRGSGISSPLLRCV
jgi:4-hydroxybenzoate polyprenyltransferase